MKAPKTEIYGHTWVGWINLLVLRWLFIRLCYIIRVDIVHTDYTLFIGTQSFGQNAAYIHTKWSIRFCWPWRW